MPLRRLVLRPAGSETSLLISTRTSDGGWARDYSAAKAGRQLARIASLSRSTSTSPWSPDAVFSDGGRRSGLWAEIGPDRARTRAAPGRAARVLRNRNLLKARITRNASSGPLVRNAPGPTQGSRSRTAACRTTPAEGVRVLAAGRFAEAAAPEGAGVRRRHDPLSSAATRAADGRGRDWEVGKEGRRVSRGRTRCPTGRTRCPRVTGRSR
jgi:hypothetical protein